MAAMMTVSGCIYRLSRSVPARRPSRVNLNRSFTTAAVSRSAVAHRATIEFPAPINGSFHFARAFSLLLIPLSLGRSVGLDFLKRSGDTTIARSGGLADRGTRRNYLSTDRAAFRRSWRTDLAARQSNAPAHRLNRGTVFSRVPQSSPYLSLSICVCAYRDVAGEFSVTVELPGMRSNRGRA